MRDRSRDGKGSSHDLCLGRDARIRGKSVYRRFAAKSGIGI